MTDSEAKGFVQGKLDCMNECGVFNREDIEKKDLCDSCDYCYSQGNFGNQKEAFSMAIKALEKQIPKKPILKSGESLVHINKGDKPHEWKLNKWCSWCCPVCGWFVGERYNRVRNDGSIHPHDQRKSNYCNECGQAIDWSDEE